MFRGWNQILIQKMKQNEQKMHGYIVQVEHLQSIQYGEFRKGTLTFEVRNLTIMVF